jgi:hypothetical protein
MAYITKSSAGFGTTADGALKAGSKAAIKAAKAGTLTGAFKAQGIMTETVIITGSVAAVNSSFNQGAQGAANK